ncbi:2-oxoisovalerate dehydrogenase, E1 component, alpha and beta subunit [Luminiphilus syltensis NOR5-1B]|uniref:2-oxoisovalerate dehydrogenase subunit beta n=1 Tax=Luminiphilus syltensis NOR5-1B TaxID=565045 RepID=B8KSP8_9GAMM|nr:alpha-ketoacid dehydrogenase subunit beta [Luminiphilus syltensis]EED34108.1 2-oxoisovalerate dehydrogenase, E1 component, alpha and beta subunit [Luminiphilus syltensis NOR5-1B]
MSESAVNEHPVKTLREALNEALHQEMERDSRVIIMGEEVAGGAGCKGSDEAYGGVFGVTKGLGTKFGRTRVIDTPITESAIIGAAAGAANTGLRPVAELMFIDFIGVCFDQIFNQAAKFRYMFGGKARTPIVIRGTAGAGMRAGAQHSSMLHPVLTHIPGLKVVMPSNAYDAKGLMISAIRDDDPVVFIEHKLLYETKCPVPDEMYTIPFGEAAFAREGSDATIVAFGAMVPKAIAVADKLAKEGIHCDVIDPRTTSPLDSESILESVEVSGRLICVDEANPRCSLAADVSAIVAEHAFSSLRAPVKCVTAPHTPVPFAPVLEDAYIPSEAAIEQAVRETLGGR